MGLRRETSTTERGDVYSSQSVLQINISMIADLDGPRTSLPSLSKVSQSMDRALNFRLELRLLQSRNVRLNFRPLLDHLLPSIDRSSKVGILVYC